MSRRKIDPLRPLTEGEVSALTRLSRSKSESATRIAWASLILAVAWESDNQRAAESIGRRSGDAVSRLVARFNEVRGRPTPEADGTASWSLSALQKALRSASDSLPRVSTYTLWRVLHEAGASPQKARSWCPTRTVLRKRKGGTALVTDPERASKKS